MSGFKNAPSIPEFKVGMRVRRTGGEWFDVALAPRPGEDPVNRHGTTICGAIDHFELDLDSIWVGRQYERGEEFIPEARYLEVLLVSDTHVGFLWGTDGSGLVLQTRETFLGECTPAAMCACVGVASPPIEYPQGIAPEVAAVKEGTGWTPQVGQECEFLRGQDGCRFIPLYVGPLYTYGHAAHLPKEGIGEILSNSHLRPLPADPPVKKNDYVEVRWRENGAIVDVGMVADVGSDGFETHVKRWYAFDAVAITKLVPAQ